MKMTSNLVPHRVQGFLERKRPARAPRATSRVSVQCRALRQSALVLTVFFSHPCAAAGMSPVFLPKEALVAKPPIPFQAGSVIRGRRTLAEDELRGKLFSPSGKQKKVHTCPAENCHAAFKRSEHLKRHYRSVHMGSKRECRAPRVGRSMTRLTDAPWLVAHSLPLPTARLQQGLFSQRQLAAARRSGPLGILPLSTKLTPVHALP